LTIAARILELSYGYRRKERKWREENYTRKKRDVGIYRERENNSI